ncbi:MAG: hypothetical protein JW904_08620 [Spirochaetales bacterium]|nr:hypothetical protein [Spirochaetales bacterium]
MGKKETLLKIVVIELEDVIEDLNALIDSYSKRNKAGEVTDYVYKENIALLTNEQNCIREFHRELKTVDVSAYADEKETALKLKQIFLDLLCEHCYAPAVESIVKRKIEKALDFIISPP